ncbi:hypothetical protein C0J52_11050 [Blattella germanica]|nr:hypothetical protein C0J52_11050 [Blattella germanica]
MFPLVHQHHYNKQVHCSVKNNYVKEFSSVLNDGIMSTIARYPQRSKRTASWNR